MTTTTSPAQTLRAILGTKPTAHDLRDLLADLEGMSDDAATMIYGSPAAKAAFQKLVFTRFIAANTTR